MNERLKFVGMTEIAAMAGVKHASTVSNWRARHPDFPSPYQELSMGAIFLESEVLLFLQRHPGLGQAQPGDRIPGRRDRIRERMAQGDANVSEIAREFGVSRGTIYNAARDRSRAARG